MGKKGKRHRFPGGAGGPNQKPKPPSQLQPPLALLHQQLLQYP